MRRVLQRLAAPFARARRFTLHSGERQTGSVADAVRADHRLRYTLAADRLARDLAAPPTPLGLDLFCGTGYGTDLLADRLRGPVVGLDGSRAAIAVARRRATSARASFAVQRFPFPLPHAAFDYVVCFESLEHVEHDRRLLGALAEALKPGGRLWLSAPDEGRLPLGRNPNPFHVRHYDPERLVDDLARPLGLELERWYGQDAYEIRDGRVIRELSPESMAPREGDPGQTRIFCFRT